ncbi:hypothetical protein ASG52_10765 [Methylobacterium sp. Leaf456]|uniref:hypothetical protein n=1 Tax=Methylobacterium sp. Leaf456 TaxID=1736382 RepID=UPI0006F9A1EE|nr:hypothetical protein [Methylobacterium sp. Leaf456]KQT47743.1 hypothetical protein ASG52_10765 [Methylobacterium sp. Leaf456]
MRDLFKIAAAGAVLSAYAALVPSVVEAVPAQPETKAFTHRLPQAGGAGPVSIRLETTETGARSFDARRPLVVGFSAGGASR